MSQEEKKVSLEARRRSFLEAFRRKVGEGLPTDLYFDGGWHSPDTWGEQVLPFLSRARPGPEATWSEGHEALHENPSRDHFIDLFTRRFGLRLLAGKLQCQDAVFCDLGCSTGYLLEDILEFSPGTLVAGADLLSQGLEKCHRRIPQAMLFQVDLCDIPFGDESVDAIASLNVLEHVKDDLAALREVHRILRPGGLGYLVVPHGPGLYNYYDEMLLHHRRYSAGELRRKALAAGFSILLQTAIGWTLYPAFWLAKKWSRWRLHSLSPQEKRARVERDIQITRQSRLGHLLLSLEEKALDRVSFRFGIRQLLLVKKD